MNYVHEELGISMEQIKQCTNAHSLRYWKHNIKSDVYTLRQHLYLAREKGDEEWEQRIAWKKDIYMAMLERIKAKIIQLNGIYEQDFYITCFNFLPVDIFTDLEAKTKAKRKNNNNRIKQGEQL